MRVHLCFPFLLLLISANFLSAQQTVSFTIDGVGSEVYWGTFKCRLGPAEIVSNENGFRVIDFKGKPGSRKFALEIYDLKWTLHGESNSLVINKAWLRQDANHIQPLFDCVGVTAGGDGVLEFEALNNGMVYFTVFYAVKLPAVACKDVVSTQLNSRSFNIAISIAGFEELATDLDDPNTAANIGNGTAETGNEIAEQSQLEIWSNCVGYFTLYDGRNGNAIC